MYLEERKDIFMTKKSLLFLLFLLPLLFSGCLSQRRRNQATQDFLTLGKEYYAKEEYQKALSYYQAAYRFTSSEQIQYNIGRTLLISQRYDQFERVLSRFLRDSPDNILLLELKGYARYQESLFLKEESKKEEEVLAAEELAEKERVAQQEAEEAGEVPLNEEELAQLSPSERRREVRKEERLRKKKEREEAKKAKEKEVDAESGETGLEEGAEKGSEEEEVTKPVEKGNNRSRKLLRESEEKAKESQEIFEAILERDPYRETTLYNLGTIYSDQEENDKAEELWQRALSVNGTNPLVINKLLLLYQAREEKEKIHALAAKIMPKMASSSALMILPFLIAAQEYKVGLDVVKELWESNPEQRKDGLTNFYYGSLLAFNAGSGGGRNQFSQADLYLQRAIDFGFADKELILSFVFTPQFSGGNRYRTYFRKAGILDGTEKPPTK